MFLILLQRTQNLTPPAPKIFFPLEKLPKADSEGLQLHRCLVERQEEVSLCRMPPPAPVPDPLSGSCRTGDKLGKIDRDSNTHSLREIILNLNEFKLPELEAGVQGSAVDTLASKPRPHRLLFRELHTVTSSSF